MKRDTVTFVCTANVCRSPMAERLFADAICKEGAPLDKIKVVSAGVSAVNGDGPSYNSVKAMDEIGIDISNHKSQRLNLELMQSSIAIFVMTESHRALIHMTYENLNTPIYLMREFMSPAEGNQIPDPFGQSLHVYKLSRDSMIEAIPSIINFLKNKQ